MEYIKFCILVLGLNLWAYFQNVCAAGELEELAKNEFSGVRDHYRAC